MSIGSQLAASIKKLMLDHGTEVTFRRTLGRTAADYDPATSSFGAASNDDETVIAAFVRYRESEIDGTNIQRGDRRVLMSAYQSDGSELTKQPQTNDLIVGENDIVRVVQSRIVKSGSSAIGYELQVRE